MKIGQSNFNLKNCEGRQKQKKNKHQTPPKAEQSKIIFV